MGYSDQDLRSLKRRAAQIRGDIIEMIPLGKVGHLGGSCSIADIAAALYFRHMNVFADPKDPRRDRCVFSKGHAVLAQYACFAELGYFDRGNFLHVKTLHGLLQGHPDMEHTPGIEAVTGSLGQGLSVSLGMAFGLKLQKSGSRVYCVVGDGELNEGQIWEAAMAASAYRMDNLCAIIDCNHVQATDTVERVLVNGQVREKWASFGWNTLEINGHDFAEILAALDSARATADRPTAIIANTVKGKGFAFAEGKAAFHNAALNEEQYRLALQCVEQMKKEAEL